MNRRKLFASAAALLAAPFAVVARPFRRCPEVALAYLEDPKSLNIARLAGNHTFCPGRRAVGIGHYRRRDCDPYWTAVSRFERYPHCPYVFAWFYGDAPKRLPPDLAAMANAKLRSLRS